MIHFSLTEQQVDGVERALGHFIEARERDHSVAVQGTAFEARCRRRVDEAYQLRSEVMASVYGAGRDAA